MKLVTKSIDSWPKLAWVASFGVGQAEIHVIHGPLVETSDEWIVEAAWAGPFDDGDFDRTDLVFGTGLRVRGDFVDFVSSGTVFDQLWYVTREQTTYVSNSLPALLAVADLNLLDNYSDYRKNLHSIRGGLDHRIKSIPTDAADVSSVYFNNLRLRSGVLGEIQKPDSAPVFGSYEQYRDFLFAAADRLRQNYASSRRRHPVSTLGTISSGYDSPAAAVVAVAAGCTHAVTISDSSSFWRGSDSGKPIADAIGMTCDEYDRTAKHYPDEEAIWAGCAWGGTLNYTLFEYPSAPCLFFTGWHGDTMWDRVEHAHVRRSDPFVRPDVGALGLSELRLIRGIWHCAVPFWGVRHAHELVDVTQSVQMRPWQLGGHYDKPIPRRLVEEAGAARESFGRIKKNASLPDPFAWPRSPSAQASFSDYLAGLGGSAPSRLRAEFIRRLATAESLFHSNLSRRLNIQGRFRPWSTMKANRVIYQWANQQLKSRYAAGLRVPQHEYQPTPKMKL